MNNQVITSNPNGIRKPFGNYVHGIFVPEGHGFIMTSGQLGASKEDATPENISDQCEICFSNIVSILNDFGSTARDIVKVTGYLTKREDFAPYMKVRDAFIPQPVCSTLLIVGGFTREEFKVEVEVVAITASRPNET